MPKDETLYLEHMLGMARKIEAKTAGIDRAGYDADENLRLALAHLVQVIGEAARRVSPEMTSQYPEIPWREIVGMRHKIVHDYLNVDEDVLWQVITQDIPDLATSLTGIVGAE